tara:strand:+ start:149 stop:790 length:642 start_codon:yes stop_codon:yes gene_type:complete
VRHLVKSENAQAKDALIQRIEKCASRGTSCLTDWERNFLSSLLESAKKWGRLTAKQHEVYQRIEKKTDPAFQASRKAWNDSWTEDKRAKAVFAAKYYKANPPYFSDAADRILNDPAYVPSEKLYRKMVENRYVQRALANAASGALYEVGSMVTIRDARHSPLRSSLRGQDVLVLEVEQDVLNATKGSRVYTVLPIGSGETLTIQERWLKKSRK